MKKAMVVLTLISLVSAPVFAQVVQDDTVIDVGVTATSGDVLGFFEPSIDLANNVMSSTQFQTVLQNQQVQTRLARLSVMQNAALTGTQKTAVQEYALMMVLGKAPGVTIAGEVTTEVNTAVSGISTAVKNAAVADFSAEVESWLQDAKQSAIDSQRAEESLTPEAQDALAAISAEDFLY
ncbi:MAG: hypothetical protein PHQ54_03480 [Candidatus Omnitrophica bacterium]|nr:hypothetical protein [Candidatus Omnitrophota bacterium]